MIASDIDGTLLDYDHTTGTWPVVNHALIAQLVAQGTKQIALITNQGGLPFGVMGASKFPKPIDFAERLMLLGAALSNAGIHVASVWVCVYHPKAQAWLVAQAKEELDLALTGWVRATVYSDPGWRKPSPAMLESACATVYYGDADEDEQAAQAAGCEFVRVERFYRPK
jgi:histidinol phosphatase-like enzyme